jgi:hypothetical protein
MDMVKPVYLPYNFVAGGIININFIDLDFDLINRVSNPLLSTS